MQPVAAFLALLQLISTASTHLVYVKPNEPYNCSYQPCLVLEQYSQQQASYFTTGSTIVLLAGNHSLVSTVNLTGIADITITGEESDAEINVISRNTAFKFESVTNLTIHGLTFIMHSSDTHRDTAVLYFGAVGSAVITNSKFQGNGSLKSSNFVRAIFSRYSTLTIVSCHFAGGTADNGGAIYASAGSTLDLTGNTFTGNKARVSGGAISIEDSTITIQDNSFLDNSCLLNGGALFGAKSRIDVIGNSNSSRTTEERNDELGEVNLLSKFVSNTAQFGGAIYLYGSQSLFNGSGILFKRNSAGTGGGIYMYSTGRYIGAAMTSETKHLYFIGNTAFSHGGAIYTHRSYLELEDTGTHYFLNNSAGEFGGAIYNPEGGRVSIMGNSYFAYNRAFDHSNSDGSAIEIKMGRFDLSGNAMFTKNEAAGSGTVTLIASTASLYGNSIKFVDNVANIGGGISIHSTDNSKPVEISASFSNNRAAECGGAIVVENAKKVTFNSINVTGNSVRAMCIFDSNVTFHGATIVADNNDGGIRSGNSFLSFANYTLFQNNSAFSGGAINSIYGSIVFNYGGGVFENVVTIFRENTATTDGGALYLSSTSVIVMENTIHFTLNSAKKGGAMYFSNLASLTLRSFAILNSSHNHASEYGGAIYHEDTASHVQCNYDSGSIIGLPNCFLQLITDGAINSSINSYHDTATSDGSFLFGGLLDKCILNPFGKNIAISYSTVTNSLIHVQAHSNNNTRKITSLPYQLCSCEGNNCSETRNVTVYRGQRFTIPLVAIAEGGTIVSTLVTTKFSSTARLRLNQTIQNISRDCADLEYNLYSTEILEELILYPDGPCRDTGLAKTVINVTLLPCPDGFTLSTEECVCEERLQDYANCTIDETPDIVRKSGSTFWASGLYENESYQGVILNIDCPFDYCKTQTLVLSLRNPDIQCDLNRGGVLCGACATNYSLMLGGTRCDICPDTYFTLLLPFAAAGIFLVIFLSVLRLTVATGMLNSVILFANIVQVNKHVFLPTGRRNILTVFIAWLNLDLGIETCFYDGMDAYAQTWLQFAFPVYLWILISLITLTSRYSLTVSKLIGHNPVAVLATLLLMSYTKILRVIIEVYSFTRLRYPQKTVKVWLKDANVSYLQSEHLFLTVVTTLVLVFLFLPYTFLLLLGYKLYRFSDRKYLKWLNRVKLLLDPYYAPYKKHTRYWTGFLLIVRCALYTVFSFGTTSNSLLAIIITFSIIGITSGYLASGKIYNKLVTNVLEASLYLQLIILSAVNLAEVNLKVVTFSLANGSLLIIVIAIILYHIHVHILLPVKSALWPKMVVYRQKRIALKNATESNVEVNETSDSAKAITTTMIDLRESLLEPISY